MKNPSSDCYQSTKHSTINSHIEKKTTKLQNTRPKDSSAKTIFDNHVLCAQFLRGYTGIDLLKDVQPEDIEDISERFLWLWQEERDSDSVKKIHLRDCPDSGTDTLFLITLIEHQSTVDYDMSFRILRYIVQILTDYAEDRKDTVKKKDFRYPPVLPVIFFDDDRNWTAETNFKNRVYLSDILGEFIPDFHYLVVPLARYSNQELIDKGDELSLIMLIDKLRSAADFRQLKEIPREYFEELAQNAPEAVLELIAKIISVLLFRLNVPKDEVAEFTDHIERRDFSMLLDHFEAYDVQATRAESRAQGRTEGLAEGRSQGLAEGRKVGLALSTIDFLEDLGTVSDNIRDRIMQESDLEILKKWNKAAARAKSVEQFAKDNLS